MDAYEVFQMQHAVKGFKLTLVEPYHRSYIAKGLESVTTATFSRRSLQLFHHLNIHHLPSGAPEGFKVIGNHGFMSLCISVSPDEDGHEIATFDRITKDKNPLGYIPKYDCLAIELNSVLGCMTADLRFASVLIYSKHLSKTTAVFFDIFESRPLLIKTCSKVPFVCGSGLHDIAINSRDAAQRMYRIALLKDLYVAHPEKPSPVAVELRLWDPIARAAKLLCLDCILQIEPKHRYDLNYLKFTPCGRFLCFLCKQSHEVCLLIDAAVWKPLYILPLISFDPFKGFGRFWPIFTTCGSKLAVCNDMETFLWFFEIPSRDLQSLKELCRHSILCAMADYSKVARLPLPNDLKDYLTEASLSSKLEDSLALTSRRKRCNLM